MPDSIVFPDSTVFIVDDDDAIRDSLSMLVEVAGFRTETFSSAETFLEAYQPDRTGCLVADVRMPGMSGLDLLKEMTRRSLGLPVIVITGHGDVAMAVGALKAGAADFIEKPFNDALIIESIRDALERFNRDHQYRLETLGILSRIDQLTPREREVMDLVVGGLANKVIADRLAISIRTVEIHRARVMEKMKARNVSELVRMVLRAQSGVTATRP